MRLLLFGLAVTIADLYLLPPRQVGVGAPIFLFLGALFFCAPVSPKLERRSWSTVWLISTTASLLIALRWIPFTMDFWGGTSRGWAWISFGLACLLYSGCRLIVLRAVASIPCASSRWRSVAIGMTLASFESIAARHMPWLEVLSLPYLLADFPITQWVIRHAGMEISGLLLWSMIVRLIIELSWWRLFLTFGLLLVPLSQPDTEAMNFPMTIGLIQSPKTAVRLRAELPDLMVLPEGSCAPPCLSYSGLPRLFGARITEGRKTYNAALFYDSSDRLVWRKTKTLLAPIIEQGIVHAGSDASPDVAIARVVVTVLICYEIMSRDLMAAGDSHLGITISSDLYDPSGQASSYLTKSTWLRALEFHKPVIRVSDSTGSAAFESDGSVSMYLGREDDGVVISLFFGERVRSTIMPVSQLWLLAIAFPVIVLRRRAWRRAWRRPRV